MSTFTSGRLLTIGTSAALIAILMTPIAGIWIWLALALGAWISWLCVDEVETAIGR